MNITVLKLIALTTSPASGVALQAPVSVEIELPASKDIFVVESIRVKMGVSRTDIKRLSDDDLRKAYKKIFE